MTRERAEELARAYVARRLQAFPYDANLERISEVVSRRGSGNGTTVGYTVRFGRSLEGLPVRGNGVADHIAVLVGSDGVVAWSRSWPEIVVDDASAAQPMFMTIGEATSLAADEISRAAKGELVLLSARVVWGVSGSCDGSCDLVPAYALEGADGTPVVVDALTGRVGR